MPQVRGKRHDENQGVCWGFMSELLRKPNQELVDHFHTQEFPLRGTVSRNIARVFNPKLTWDRVEMNRLNLACGNDYRMGWDNVDLHAKRVDKRIDMTRFPWDLPTNHYDYVLANDCFEHLPPLVDDKECVLGALTEIHRILKPGGRVFIGVPDATNIKAAIRNPTHYRFFGPDTFDFLEYEKHTDGGLDGLLFGFRIILKQRVRRLTLSHLFDSTYHLPKYFGHMPNIGRSWHLVFILEKR